MTVQSVEVFNFQSLAHAKIAIGKVTVLVGDSNVGKTAFLRAVRGVVDNTAAVEILRSSCSELKVVIQTDKNIITWHKGPGLNVYNIDGVVLKGVGRSCPEILETALGFVTRRILGFDFNPNFRDQFSPPMLIFESESERLVKLGIISGVGLLQTAVRIASKDRKGLEGSVRQTGEDLRLKGLELKGYDGLDGKLASADSCSTVVSGLKSRIGTYARVCDLQDRKSVLVALSRLPGGTADARITAARSRTGTLRTANSLAQLRSEVRKLGGTSAKPIDKVRISTLRAAVQLRILLGSKKQIPDVDVKPMRLRALIAQAACKLLKIRDQIKDVTFNVKTVEASLESLTNARRDLLKALGVCPVCQTNLSGN